MNRKELTKTFVMLSNKKKLFTSKKKLKEFSALGVNIGLEVHGMQVSSFNPLGSEHDYCCFKTIFIS